MNTDSTALVAVTATSLVVSVLLYVWTAIALSALFRKSGEAAWKGWVPVYNLGVLFQLAGYPWWSVLLILLPVAGPVIVFVVFVLAAHRVGRAFGYGGGMTVLAVLLPPVWATVLIWIMLATALWALRACTTSDRWLQQAPIAIYAGWLTAASVVALMLCLAGDDIGLGMTGWGWIGLALATGLAVTVQRLSPHAPEYGLTVIWALTGIIAANWGDWLFVLGAALGLGIVGWTIIATRQERA